MHFGGSSPSDDHNPATREFELYCEDNYKNTILSSMLGLGSCIGYLFFPMISDNKGPRIALIASWVTGFLGCLIMSLAYDFDIMLVGNIVAGFGINPALTIQYAFINGHSSKFLLNNNNRWKFSIIHVYRNNTCVRIWSNISPSNGIHDKWLEIIDDSYFRDSNWYFSPSYNSVNIWITIFYLPNGYKCRP